MPLLERRQVESKKEEVEQPEATADISLVCLVLFQK